VLTLQPLGEEEVRTVVRRALAAPHGLAAAVTLAADAEEHLLRMAGGDARKALTALEAAAGSALAAGVSEVDLGLLEKAIDTAAVRYDRDGDQHYDVASALIKSIRGSDVDASLHYLARMIEAGEDPRFIVRRLVIVASEDIGMADPTALTTAVAAMHAVQFIGMPEATLTLSHAVIHLATAPKSNAATLAIGAAVADVRAGLAGPVPAHLRDAHYRSAGKLGHGVGYRYAHDAPGGVAAQQYAPDAVHGRDYYQPTGYGAERPIRDRVANLRRILRGSADPDPGARPGGAGRRGTQEE